MDFVVNTNVVKKTQEYFQNYMRASNIKSIYTIYSAHGFVCLYIFFYLFEAVSEESFFVFRLSRENSFFPIK